MERARLIAGVTLVLVIAAALIFVIVRNAGEVDEPTTAGTTAPTEDVEPTPEPTPEADEEPVAVPTPDTTGRDFDHIFREIVAFRDWLFANPDPELLSLIYHPDCDCYELAKDVLETLNNRNLSMTNGGFAVDQVDIVEDFESLARLEVVVDQVAHDVITTTDEVVTEVPAEGFATFSVALVREGQRWRIRTIAEIPG